MQQEFPSPAEPGDGGDRVRSTPVPSFSCACSHAPLIFFPTMTLTTPQNITDFLPPSVVPGPGHFFQTRQIFMCKDSCALILPLVHWTWSGERPLPPSGLPACFPLGSLSSLLKSPPVDGQNWKKNHSYSCFSTSSLVCVPPWVSR